MRNYRFGRRIRIERPAIRNPEEEKLWRDVHKYAELIPSELEPNLGRLQEIKDEIRNQTYLTSETVEETAARLALRFMRRE